MLNKIIEITGIVTGRLCRSFKDTHHRCKSVSYVVDTGKQADGQILVEHPLLTALEFFTVGRLSAYVEAAHIPVKSVGLFRSKIRKSGLHKVKYAVIGIIVDNDLKSTL